MPITIKDIAQAANVSYSTVSRALSDSPRVRPETRHHIQKLAREMGYEPNAIARGLATKRTYSLGVVVLDITDSFISELVRALDRVALDNGYSLILSHCGADPQREMAAIKLLRQQRVDAIIVPDPRVADSSLPLLEDSGIPVILVNRRAYRYSVGTDNVEGARQAVEHLLELGHARVGYIGGSSHLVENPERRAGYEAALRARGIALDPSLVVEGNGWPEGGWQGMTELMKRPAPPTAVFCYNDLTAIGAIEAASAAGLRLPEQLSVVGFDDIHLAPYVFPPLTTVAQDTDRIANLAVEMALRLACGDDSPSGSALPGRLVVRRSTAPPGRRG